ncbi:MAG: hypothetical protein QW371_02015 [Candidatus Bathyarchaeia archaeon]
MERQDKRRSHITSVEFDPEDFEYIMGLLKEGRIRSLKEFVEKCVKFGKEYTIDRWNGGLFYFGPVRVVILAKRMLDVMIQKLREEDYEIIGRELGDVIGSLLMLRGIDGKDPARMREAFDMLNKFGLGVFELSGEKIQVAHPTLPSEMTKAMLQQIFGMRLEAIKTLLDVHFYRMVKERT